jgi:AGCS family alanine or glycine:cation symporter
MPNIFLNIFKSAFNFKPFFTGFLANLIIGAQRGIFASESGLGTGSIASSVTESNNAEKVGLIQIFGTYITTFLICTSTAIIILTSNYQELSFLDINGIELTMHAFNYHFGNLGYYALLISIILFAFSTILTGYYYIESNIKFLFKKPNLVLIKILTLIFLFVGSLISSIKLWFISDTLIAILAIINMYALIKLKNDIK